MFQLPTIFAGLLVAGITWFGYKFNNLYTKAKKIKKLYYHVPQNASDCDKYFKQRDNIVISSKDPMTFSSAMLFAQAISEAKKSIAVGCIYNTNNVDTEKFVDSCTEDTNKILSSNSSHYFLKEAKDGVLEDGTFVSKTFDNIKTEEDYNLMIETISLWKTKYKVPKDVKNFVKVITTKTNYKFFITLKNGEYFYF